MVRWVVGSTRQSGPIEEGLRSWGARCSSVVRAFAHGAMGGPIEEGLRSWGARCSSVVRASTHGSMGRRIDPTEWTH